MVKVGFICEGFCEKIIVESKKFKELLNDNKLQFVKAEIPYGGGNKNLEPGKIEPSIANLKEAGAEIIFILTDLDKDLCVTKTKEKIKSSAGIIVIVAKQEIEAWFLADSKLLGGLFRENRFQVEFPELELDPIKKLKELFITKTGKGIYDSKPKFASYMINNGFSIANAAAHPNCSSAQYFINKLRSLGSL